MTQKQMRKEEKRLKHQAFLRERARQIEEQKKKKAERVIKWLDGEYKPVTPQIKGSSLPTESIEEFIKRGGTVKVLKPMTEGKQNQMMHLKKRRMKGRMK